MTKTQENDGFGRGIKFYADWPKDQKSRTALHIQHALTRDNALTLNLELAPIPESGKGPDWTRKIMLQLSRSELVAVCYALLGFRKTAKGSYHGTNRNKGFQVHSNPARGALFAVSEKGVQYHHIVSQDDRAEIAAFVLCRLAEVWCVDPATCLAVLSNVETNLSPVSVQS